MQNFKPRDAPWIYETWQQWSTNRSTNPFDHICESFDLVWNQNSSLRDLFSQVSFSISDGYSNKQSVYQITLEGV